MKNKSQWFLIENEQDYNDVLTRYQEIKYANKGTEDHKEKLLLVHLIETYENDLWDLPEVGAIEMIKIRMNDFGYKASDFSGRN